MYKKVLASLSVTGLLFTSSVEMINGHMNSAHAKTQKSDNAQVKVVKVNDAQFQVVPNKNAEGKVKNGKATIVDKKTGKSEELPSEVKNKDNQKANVTYKVVNNNVGGDVKLPEESGVTEYKTNWKKCALGTGGGAASGVGYGAIGATPVSVGVDSAIVGVVGGVSAGMGGAAASCFD